MVSKCALCHTIDETGCCSDEIFVTLHDTLRVSKKTGIPVDKLVHFVKVSPELKGYNEDNEFSKLWRDEKLLIINSSDVEEEGDCRFTSEKGCTIFDARPRICRVFPFWFKKLPDGKVSIYLDKDDDPKDEFCRICKDHTHEDIDGALKDCGEDDKEQFIKYCEEYQKEMDEYKKYADDLSAGKKPSEIIKERNITID